MTLPAVSKHLKVLERAGLIERRREAQWRPARLEAGPLKELADWLEQYQRFWEGSFDRLEDYLRELQLQDELAERRQSSLQSKDASTSPGSAQRTPPTSETPDLQLRMPFVIEEENHHDRRQA
jgi:hypothetical protein